MSHLSNITSSENPITNRHIEQCKDLMKKSLHRIQRKTVEMEQVGVEVLHELHRQDIQLVSQ